MLLLMFIVFMFMVLASENRLKK